MAAPPPGRKRASQQTPRRRGYYPPPEPMKNPFAEGWRHMSWGAILGLFAGAGIIATAMIAMFNAFPHVEPVIPSLRGYVREYADDAATKKVKPIETWKSTWETDYGQFKVLQSTETARLILVQLRQNLISAKKELEANPGSQIVKDQIIQLENEIKRTAGRIQDYEASAIKK